jgi:cell shape-determining protein MreD
MIFYLVLTVIAALLQTTLTNLNLVLLVVVATSVLRKDTSSLIISFVAGLILGFFSGHNLGFYSILFLLISQLCRFYRMLPISSHPLFLLPVVVVAIVIEKFASSIFLQQTINWYDLPVQLLLFYLIFGLSAFYEDRFSTRSDLRLKLR